MGLCLRCWDQVAGTSTHRRLASGCGGGLGLLVGPRTHFHCQDLCLSTCCVLISLILCNLHGCSAGPRSEDPSCRCEHQGASSSEARPQQTGSARSSRPCCQWPSGPSAGSSVLGLPFHLLSPQGEPTMCQACAGRWITASYRGRMNNAEWVLLQHQRERRTDRPERRGRGTGVGWGGRAGMATDTPVPSRAERAMLPGSAQVRGQAAVMPAHREQV